MSTWDDVESNVTQLAYIDEAYPYEVDQCLIGLDKSTGKFVLLTATGCSCWDGEATAEYFDSLNDLESSLISKDRTYNPSLLGAERLVREAREAYERQETTLQCHG